MSAVSSNLAPRVRLSWGDPRFVIMVVTAIGLLVLPIVAYYNQTGQIEQAIGIDLGFGTFTTNLVARILIFAIAAASLDLLVGYGGMVSFGHAAYLGVGTYAVGVGSYYATELCFDAESMAVCSYSWLQSGFLHFPVAIVASVLVALFIGAISLRTGGLYFIMITFAFTQMLFFLGISLEVFNGDDGMNIERSTFFGYSAHDQLLAKPNEAPDDMLLYYSIVVVLVISLIILRRLVNSRFGMVIRGSKSNSARMAAIGFPTYRYRLTAFVIAGAICGLAGALFANHTPFLSPASMSWIISGDLLFMVIMGGMETIFGPVAGAIAFLGLDEWLGEVESIGSSYRQVVFGPLLVLLVLFARQGIFGLLPERWSDMGRFLVGLIVFLLGFELFIFHLSDIHPLGVIISLIVGATVGRAVMMFFTERKTVVFAVAMAVFILGNIITVLLHEDGAFTDWVIAELAIDAALIVVTFVAAPFVERVARFLGMGKGDQETQNA